MNNRQMARAMLQQAEVILAEAHYLNTHRHWHLVIRRCQESVELALKAVLLWSVWRSRVFMMWDQYCCKRPIVFQSFFRAKFLN